MPSRKIQKQCSGQCARVLPNIHFTTKNWRENDKSRLCLKCMQCNPRGHWPCVKCSTVKPLSEYGIWLGMRKTRRNDGTTRCDECKKKRKWCKPHHLAMISWTRQSQEIIGNRKIFLRSKIRVWSVQRRKIFFWQIRSDRISCKERNAHKMKSRITKMKREIVEMTMKIVKMKMKMKTWNV